MGDPVLDDLRDAKLEEVPERRGMKKLLWVLTAVFILSIVIIYFLPGDVLHILEGRIESSKLEGFTAEYDGGKVIFSEEVYNELKSLYLENQETEIKVCLTGEKVGEDYYITELYIPKTFSATVYSVVSEGCGDALISMHTHPFKHCLFSEQDIESSEGMIGLMCEIDRFSFYV